MELRFVFNSLFVATIFYLFKVTQNSNEFRSISLDNSAAVIKAQDAEEPLLVKGLRSFDFSCQDPTPPLHGKIIGTDFNVGSTVHAACDSGYHLTGTPTATCHVAPNPFLTVTIWDPPPNWECQKGIVKKDTSAEDISQEDTAADTNGDEPPYQYAEPRIVDWQRYKEVPHHSIEGIPEQCNLPKAIGRCKAAFPRYYFNSETKECDYFIYGGCGGNENNFMTLEKCDATCLSHTT